MQRNSIRAQWLLPKFAVTHIKGTVMRYSMKMKSPLLLAVIATSVFIARRGRSLVE
jgi:hypothetical protein